MVLNIQKTHLLNGLIGDEKCIYSAPFVSNANNDTFVDEVATWEAAFDVDNLYGTREDSTTYKISVTGFPKPPKRS